MNDGEWYDGNMIGYRNSTMKWTMEEERDDVVYELWEKEKAWWVIVSWETRNDGEAHHGIDDDGDDGWMEVGSWKEGRILV